MTTISRRAAFGGIAGLLGGAASVAVAAISEGERARLEALIRRTDDNARKLDPLLDIADSLHLAFDPSRVDEIREFEDRVFKEYRELLAFPVTQPDTIVTKLRYIRPLIALGGFDEWDAFEVLLSIQPSAGGEPSSWAVPDSPVAAYYADLERDNQSALDPEG